VPDSSSGSYPDPELPGTGLDLRARQGEGEAEAGSGTPSGGGSQHFESNRDGRNMNKDCKKPTQDVMQQGQRPTE
jgi:hypothetical protein